ncbi:NAD-dependent epimerase/dehydratase family protein [bacterium BD-1]|nr:NAD-dependent epimerase/dehydratase family protein [Ottowia caeni]
MKRRRYAPAMRDEGDLSPGWLVFGLTGLVGESLREAWRADDPPLLAVSRRPPADAGRLRWLAGALPAMPDPPLAPSAVVSLGPLDAFAGWFARSALAPARVVALGSTSVHAKAGSPDPGERAVAAALAAAEDTLAAACAARGSALTLLRPTLIYGRGRDRNLSRLVAFARRWRVLPLPRGARGLRQPVHADDVAAAVLRALRSPRPVPGRFDLPGGEALPFDEMARRCLAAAAPGARLLSLPGPVLRLGMALAGRSGGPGEGVLARLRQDQAYDAGPVQAALGLRSRPFRPAAEDFPGAAAAQQE